MSNSSPDAIRAAGVVLTRGVGPDLKIGVIHRQRRNDWSLPKGKLDPGEHVIEAAVRETQEETGYTPVLDVALPTQHYDVNGTPKTVTYWRASVLRGRFAKNREVDRMKWLPPEDAAQLMTYERDGELIMQAVRTPPTVPFLLLRHTTAEKRSDWQRRTGRDRDDPARGLLDGGKHDAERLVALLQAFGVRHVHSSDAERCMATVRPTALSLGRGVRLERTMREDHFALDPQTGLTRTVELFNQRWAIVLCSHRPVIPDQLAALHAAAGGPALDTGVAPGSFFAFHRTWGGPPGESRAQVVAAERHDLTPMAD